MYDLKDKRAVVGGAASKIVKANATDGFLRYPVMSTLRPAYPRGPWHYKNMHQLVVTYESTAEAVRAVVPRPLQPAEGNRVTIEWRHMSEVSGFGPYTEVGHSVACLFDGKPVIYVFQAFLDSESPTLAGREILGFPKRHGEPELKTVREVLTGTLTYGGTQVALATMPYRAVDLSDRSAEIEQELQTTQLVLKLLPDVDNHTPKIAQLVRVGIYDVRLKGAWGGPAELFMVPHVGCPVAALPVVRVLEGRQHLWDMTLSDGQVVHDYLQAERALVRSSSPTCVRSSLHPIRGELNMNLLKDKGTLVTGAASGIGKAIATAFIEAGASVLLCDLNAKALDAAARDLGTRAIGHVTDVSDERQVEAAMRAAREAFGSLDIVVNCAGFGAICPLTELPGDKWKAVQAVTLGGVFYGVKHARPADDRPRTPRRDHQHLLGERTPARRGTGRLLRGKGRRRHDHALRRAGTRRPRYPCCRHCARPGRDAADAEGAGRPCHARALPRHHPDEPPGRTRRNCRGRRVSRVRPRPVDQW